MCRCYFAIDPEDHDEVDLDEEDFDYTWYRKAAAAEPAVIFNRTENVSLVQVR